MPPQTKNLQLSPKILFVDKNRFSPRPSVVKKGALPIFLAVL